MPLSDLSTDLGLKHIFLCNPLIIITMLEILNKRTLCSPRSFGEGGKSRGGKRDGLVWNLPSALVAGGSENCALLKAVKVLDGMLVDLMMAVAG